MHKEELQITEYIPVDPALEKHQLMPRYFPNIAEQQVFFKSGVEKINKNYSQLIIYYCLLKVCLSENTNTRLTQKSASQSRLNSERRSEIRRC